MIRDANTSKILRDTNSASSFMRLHDLHDLHDL
jgi:hypothetical protein